MIKAAVRAKLEKMRGVVAIVAFRIGWNVKFGLSNCLIAVVALTAITEDFQVIHIGKNRKTERAVAGRAGIAGGNVARHLFWNIRKILVVAVHAVR